MISPLPKRLLRRALSRSSETKIGHSWRRRSTPCLSHTVINVTRLMLPKQTSRGEVYVSTAGQPCSKVVIAVQSSPQATSEKGDQAIVANDELGLYAVNDKLQVHELHSTILYLPGIDHTKLVYHHKGRPERIDLNEGHAYTKITGREPSD